MKISVIVALYNVKEYADECIESLVKQSYNNLEIILVDDGSTDETAAIVDKWAAKDERIKTIHQTNGGLSAARNSGMKAATGDCIAFIDGDDSVKEKYFETLAANMEITGADMIGVGRYENVPGEDRFREFSSVDKLTVYNDYRDYVYDTYADKEKRFFQSAIVVWGKIYKKEIWDGIEFPVGHNNEDSWVFPRVISRCTKIAISPEPLYFYRKRSGSIMSNVSDKLVCSKTESWMQQIKWWRDSDDSQSDRLLSICEKYICHYIYTNKDSFHDEYRKEMSAEYKAMVKHMIFSKHLSFKTKAKYLTFARPGKVFG